MSFGLELAWRFARRFLSAPPSLRCECPRRCRRCTKRLSEHSNKRSPEPNRGDVCPGAARTLIHSDADSDMFSGGLPELRAVFPICLEGLWGVAIGSSQVVTEQIKVFALCCDVHSILRSLHDKGYLLRVCKGTSRTGHRNCVCSGGRANRRRGSRSIAATTRPQQTKYQNKNRCGCQASKSSAAKASEERIT